LQDLPVPDLVYHPRAYCERCGSDIAASQTWKRLVKWGRYQEQYVYVCPQCIGEVAPYTRAVETVLNLAARGRTLKERRLTGKTVSNVATGIARMHGQPFLLGYYSHPLFRRLNEPVGTITTVDRWALVTPGETFEDTRLRMLSVEEVKRVMGFPESYRLLGSTKEQVWMLGNAACPPIMREILERCKAIVAPVGGREVAYASR
jgi:site-specific DNA-cytosine methylase